VSEQKSLGGILGFSSPCPQCCMSQHYSDH